MIKPLDSVRLRWAHQRELMKLHRELTERSQRLHRAYADVTREYATVEFQLEEIEAAVRRLEVET